MVVHNMRPSPDKISPSALFSVVVQTLVVGFGALCFVTIF